MQYLRQSTAATVLVGPVLDADGAAVTGAVIGDFRLAKNGTVSTMSGNTINHSHNGCYLITLTTANTDTLDRLSISMGNTAYGMTVFRYTVLTANQYDALIANGTITPAQIQSGLATAAQATAIETDTQDIQTRLPSALVDGRIDSSVGAYQTGLAPPTAAENGAAGWNRMLVDHTSTGSFGAGVGYIIATVAAILVAVNTLTSRISSGVATMFTDLIQMITGSGTANARFTAKALENAPGGGADTGARTVLVTVTLGGSPLQGAKVRLTKGAEDKLKVTNVSGQATFNCDDGTWTVAITAANASFAGATLVVDGAETPTYAMTADSITPSSPSLVTGYYTCYSELGVVESGVTVTLQVDRVPSETGLALDSAIRTATSDSNGLAQFTNLVPGAWYKVRRGEGNYYTFQISASATGSVELNSIIGT